MVMLHIIRVRVKVGFRVMLWIRVRVTVGFRITLQIRVRVRVRVGLCYGIGLG